MKKRTRMHHDPMLGSGTNILTGFQTTHADGSHFKNHSQYVFKGAVLNASSPQVLRIESRFAKIVRGIFG